MMTGVTVLRVPSLRGGLSSTLSGATEPRLPGDGNAGGNAIFEAGAETDGGAALPGPYHGVAR